MKFKFRYVQIIVFILVALGIPVLLVMEKYKLFYFDIGNKKSYTPPPIEDPPSEPVSYPIEEYRIETLTGSVFRVQEEKVSASISNYTIRVEDINSSTSSDYYYTFKSEDPLSDFFTADLDDDGYSEVYLITTSAGSGSYGNILGVVSFGDLSFSTIYVHFPKQNQLQGYRGHDRIYQEGSAIIREFPLYEEEDSNAAPQGGIKTLTYTLCSGEGGYILSPWETSRMKKGCIDSPGIFGPDNPEGEEL